MIASPPQVLIIISLRLMTETYPVYKTGSTVFKMVDGVQNNDHI